MANPDQKKPQVLDLLGGTKKRKPQSEAPQQGAAPSPKQSGAQNRKPAPAKKDALDLLSPNKKQRENKKHVGVLKIVVATTFGAKNATSCKSLGKIRYHTV